MSRILILTAALGAIALNASTATAQGTKHASPQAVFDAAKAAVAKKDYKGAFTCFTDDTIDGLAGGMIFAGTFTKAFAKFDKSGKGEELAKELDKIFDKYGITEETLKNIPKDALMGKDPAATQKAFQGLGKSVKNKAGFLEDMIKAMEKQGKTKDSLLDANAKLKDVTVTGDTAKGTVSSNKGDRPMSFKKIDGGWKIELPLELGGPKKAGPAPVPGGVPNGNGRSALLEPTRRMMVVAISQRA